MNKTLKIGWIFLGSIALLYWVVVWGTQSGIFQANHNRYFIDFDNVNGLKIADPVLIRGLVVGSVTNIELNENFCRVEIKISPKYLLKDQTQAEIQIRELLSGKQLVLFPKGEKILPNEAIIKGNAIFDFSFALSKFGKLVNLLEQQNWDIPKFSVWLNKIDTIFHNPNLLQIPDKLSQTLTHYDQIALALQQKQIITKIDTLTQQISLLIANLDNTQKNFDNLLVASQSLIPKMDTTFYKLDSILIHSKNLISQLNDSFDKLKKLETTAHAFLFKEDFYKDIQKTLYNLNQTLDHIREKRIRVIAKLWGKE